MKQLSQTEIAYLAGLFDGEGCVGIVRATSKHKKHQHNFRIRAIITNSNYELICWLKETVGMGCAYKSKKSFNKKWNEVHRWAVVGEQARMFLETIRPYSIIKKNIIDLCFQLPMGTRGKPRADETYNQQLKIFYLAKQMNKRGKAA